METKVLLRKEKSKRKVFITDEEKPEIEDHIKQRWQKIINLVADIFDVPAGLIMKISREHMEVFLKSENEDNPYPENGSDHLLHGLYCETVIGEDRPLHVENALEDDVWKDNPDVGMSMIAYFGLPIKWGDGTVFGTICALDNTSNAFRDTYRDLLKTFRDMIEQDLMLLEEKQTLANESGLDFLTNIANRRMLVQTAGKYIDDYHASGEGFTLIMIDLDDFKQINDHHGHVTGDRILKRFARVVQEMDCQPCLFSRYGGDEFVLIIKDKTAQEIDDHMHRLKETVSEDSFLSRYDVGFSYGIARMDDAFEHVADLLDEADKAMYEQKKTSQP